jgi:hypothetical protein
MPLELQFNTKPETDLDLNDRNHEIRRLLQDHDCEVTFTKVDGTSRTMVCTLRTEAMPQRVVTEEFQTTRLYKPEVLSAWCPDISEWRSFRVANVTGIRLLNA